MRERLGDGEAPLAGAPVVREQGVGQLVPRRRAAPERGLGLLETAPMMLDDLSRPGRWIWDRIAVPRQREAGRELDDALERRDVVAERIGPRLRIEADGRRDPREHVVAGDHQAVLEQADVPVRMAGKLADEPPRDLVSLTHEVRVAGEPDERAVHAPRFEEVKRRLRRRAVTLEPGCDSRRPVIIAPHLLALRVVERTLVHVGAGRLGGVLRAADMVGMEMRDHDPGHRPAQLREQLRPLLGEIRQTEAGIDQDVPLLVFEQVAVHVSRAHRHRKREPHDAVGDLDWGERMFYHARMRTEYREEPCRSALNRVKGMGFHWSLNPYMGCAHQCTFCYVRAYELRADRPSDDRYGRSIRVKVNVADVLRRELARSSWRGEVVAIGAATDPYQPAEGHFKLTRACLEALRDAANPFSIITRSPMIVRDLDVLVEAGRRADVRVVFSVPTLDTDVWRRTEPSTPPPRRRLEALTRLVEAGIDAGLGMAPILPGISDAPEQLEEVVRAAREAGATSVWANLLYLKPGTREHFLDALARDWPEELDRYERLYGDRAYLPKGQTAPVQALVADLRRKHGVRDRRPLKLTPQPPIEQLALAIQ